MSKPNNSNPKQPNTAAAEQFRRETEEAMANDLMTAPALAPTAVQAVMPASRPVPEIPVEIAGKSPANAAAPAHDGNRQILELLASGKITAAEAEGLMKAAAAQPAQPYIGGADGPATREELALALKEALGPQLATSNLGPAQMLELMGAMVEKIVRGLREPSEEEKKEIERKKLQRSQVIKEQLDSIAQKQDFQDFCPHERATSDGKTHTVITALHNYADGLVRGVCGLCEKIIGPEDEAYRQVRVSHQLAMSSAS